VTVVAELTKLREQLRAAGNTDAATSVDGLLRTLLPDQLGDNFELGDIQTVEQSLPPADVQTAAQSPPPADVQPIEQSAPPTDPVSTTS
jgi:hypothetical protein